jgi:hypothetical protein
MKNWLVERAESLFLAADIYSVQPSDTYIICFYYVLCAATPPCECSQVEYVYHSPGVIYSY